MEVVTLSNFKMSYRGDLALGWDQAYTYYYVFPWQERAGEVTNAIKLNRKNGSAIEDTEVQRLTYLLDLVARDTKDGAWDWGLKTFGTTKKTLPFQLAKYSYNADEWTLGGIQLPDIKDHLFAQKWHNGMMNILNTL